MKPQYIVHRKHNQRTSRTKQKDRLLLSQTSSGYKTNWNEFIPSKTVLIWFAVVVTIITMLNII